MNPTLKRIVVGIAVIIVVGATIWGGIYYTDHKSAAVTYKTPEEKDVYVRFALEAYDKIVQNYWAKVDDAGLADYFQLSLQKALNTPVPPALATRDRAGVAKMLAQAIQNATSTEVKKATAINTLAVLLYNIPPVGHGELLSAKQEVAFRQDVSNVNPEKDLYQNLGLAQGASTQEVEKAYQAKAEVLKGATSTEAKAELAQVTYAQKVLTDPNTKDLYDVAKIEPTLAKNIYGKTLYVGMDKISPTTFIEFGRTILAASTTPGLNSMIIDLRGNLGGALDFAQNFLGLFLGQNQYAFDLFHQGDYNVQRTVQPKFPELDRYKEIAVLTDNITQSTAEVTTAAFKRFHLGYVVGGTTRGWGTVENTFPLDTTIDPAEKYSLLLVHSLTLREDNQPIQDWGVDPDISVAEAGWQAKLGTYFHDAGLIKAIKEIIAK
jgi:hypothetical protein